MSDELKENLSQAALDIKSILMMQSQTHDTVSVMQQQQHEYQNKSSDERQAMAVDISTIKNNMISLSEYKAECETDREHIDKRLSRVEGFQRDQKKAFGGLAAGVSLIIYIGGKGVESSGKILEKIGSIFQ